MTLTSNDVGFILLFGVRVVEDLSDRKQNIVPRFLCVQPSFEISAEGQAQLPYNHEFKTLSQRNFRCFSGSAAHGLRRVETEPQAKQQGTGERFAASAAKTQAEALKLYSDTSIPQGEARKSVSRDTPGQTALEQTIIRWAIDSDPQGARVFYRVISSIPAVVKNTNEAYLMTTPYEETRAFNILDSPTRTPATSRSRSRSSRPVTSRRSSASTSVRPSTSRKSAASSCWSPKKANRALPICANADRTVVWTARSAFPADNPWRKAPLATGVPDSTRIRQSHGRRKRSCTKARRHERGKSVPPDGRVESREKNAGNHGSEPSAVHPQSYGFRLPAESLPEQPPAANDIPHFPLSSAPRYPSRPPAFSWQARRKNTANRYLCRTIA